MATSTTIANIHSDIITALSNEFPEFLEIGDYEELNDAPNTPSLFINLQSFDPIADQLPDDFAVTGAFEAYIFYPVQDDILTKKALREKALEVATFVQGNFWGNPDVFSEAKFKLAEKDEFSPVYEGVNIWRVDWEQDFYIKKGD